MDARLEIKFTLSETIIGVERVYTLEGLQAAEWELDNAWNSVKGDILATIRRHEE